MLLFYSGADSQTAKLATSLASWREIPLPPVMAALEGIC
jgi:hypothetical protein